MPLRSAPFRAVLGTGAVLGLVLALALAVMAWSDHEANEERVAEHTVMMARLFADQTARQLDAVSLAGATLEELLASGTDPVGAEVRAALKQMVVNLPLLRGVALVDRQGQVVASNDPAEIGIRVDVRDWGPWPERGLSVLGPLTPARRLIDLDPTRVRSAPQGVAFVPMLRALAIPRRGELLLAALINVDSLVNFQEVTLNDDRMATALLDYGGTLLGASRSVSALPGASLAGLAPFARFLPDRETGSWVGPGLRAGTQIAAFRVTRVWPVAVVVEFDDAASRAQWWQDSRGQLAVGALVIAALLPMTWLAARSVRTRDAAQARVAEQERELRTTLAALSELVFRCDARGVLRFVNPAWTEVAGGTAAGWVGRALHEVVDPDDRPALETLLQADARSGPHSAALRLRDAQGALRFFDCVLAPLPGPDAGFVGSAVDVTERRRSRQQLQAQLAFTETLLESSPLPMSVVGRDRRYRLLNHAWEAFSGRRRDEAIGSIVGAHLPEAERRAHETRDAEVYATGQPVRYEARVPDATGRLRDVMIEKRPLAGAGGRPESILAVIIDVTEFREAERATREARDAAEESARTKSEFVANMSHELRTPLQSIIGFSELGQRRAAGEPRVTAMFGEIHASGQRMLSLVNDLLDVARIESSVGTLHLERGDLRNPVREVVAELQALAARRHLVIDARLPGQPVPVKIDPLRMQQVVRNVLANALRFSPENGRIEIGIVTGDGVWRLEIADRGPGIPEAELEMVFEAFVQSSRTKDGSGGTGLGLAICRSIMQAHGGRISARNRQGGGSVFEIELPARRSSGETMPMPL